MQKISIPAQPALANAAMPTRRQWLQSSLAATAAIVLATTRTAWAQNQRVLRVGHQKGWLSILKSRGTLEKRLAPLGVSVRWIEFTAGPPQLEALNVGSIDFGDVGEAPPIFAQAAGAPLAYVGATAPRPELEAVLVPKDSPIRAVADLKGKRVAYNKGANVHYFLVKLLQKHGLQYSDVQSIFLAPADARAAFERGAVDAWAIWDPFFAEAQKTLNARVLADAAGVAGNRWYYFSAREFAARNADALRIVLQEIEAVEKWAEQNPAAAAAELARVLGLNTDVTALYLSRVRFGTVTVTREILGEQQQIADTFFDLKLIPKKLNLLDAAAVELLPSHG